MSIENIIHILYCFPSGFTHLPISKHKPTYIWTGRSSLFWKVKSGRHGGGKKNKRTFGFLQNHSLPQIRLPPLPQQLSSRISAWKPDKSNPEPSADSNLNKKTRSRATRVTPFLLPLPLFEKLDSDRYGKKPSCVSHRSDPMGPGQNPEDSWKQLLWDQLQLRGKEEKRGWIHSLQHMTPFWPQKSLFLFSLPNKKFLLPSSLRLFS